MDDSCELKVENEDGGDSNLRTVVILRGEKGYGLTVSGESPVLVQEVREGGPAALSGVKKGDSIIRVNDTLVSKVNHTNVVMIIKSSARVKLTLKSGDESAVPSNDSSHKAFSHTVGGNKSVDLITPPLPVNIQLQNQLDENRIKMLHKFLDRQRKVKESIILELTRGPPSKTLQKNLEKELESVNRQINTFMEELKNVKVDDTQLQSHSRSSRSPPSSRNSGTFQTSHPHAFHPYNIHNNRSISSVPPPLPARNRTLISQSSTPNMSASLFLPTSHSSFNSCANAPNSPVTVASSAPPLPPRPPHLERAGDVGNTLSLESIPNVSNLVHSNSSGSDSSCRQSHHRVKSSPDPLGVQRSSPVSNRHSGCDTGDASSWSRVNSTINEAEPPPPGTPPPPYHGSSIPPFNSEEGGEEAHCATLDDCEVANGERYSGPPNLLGGVISPQESYNHLRSSVYNFSSKCNSKNVSPFGSQVTSPTSPDGQTISSSPILTMEDEDGDILVEDHGPFESLKKLMKHNAYLAVFVNYVISNCDPSSLFFYMITHLYIEGGPKERKKWAYEIHSSFLLPSAPMKLSNIDESILYEIDETLQNDLDKEEILKKLFCKARQRSKADLNEQLADFRCKRSAGLGSLFGPADSVLQETIHNKNKEISVVEDLLVPILESISEDLKNQSDLMTIMASSLATILWKYFIVKNPQTMNVIDRCPLFVNKDRPLRSKLLRGNKKQVVRDHSFNLVTYYSVNHCNHCQIVIWGVAPQGYQCANCEMNIHKSCVKNVEETCVGQVHKNERSRDTKFSSFLLKIMPEENRRKTSNVNPSLVDRARRGVEDDSILGIFLENEGYTGEKVPSGSGSGGKEQRRSDLSIGSGHSSGALTNSHQPNNGGSVDEDPNTPLEEGENSLAECPSTAGSTVAVAAAAFSDNTSNSVTKSQGGHKKRNSSAINRSESCKEKQHSRKTTRETRKNSDPNIPTSKAGDVDGDSALTFHSGSSSNSSLSQSQESPPGNSSEQVQVYASALDSDSDIEADADLPDWTQRLKPDVVERLSSKDRKRQDTINELFHTEQSHVRVLKVLQSLFHQPLRQSSYVSMELLDRLFPNLDQMLKFHNSFNKAMKKRRQEESLVNTVGDILMAMFDGEEGAQFQQAAGEFVASQSYALESLKQQQKREQKLASFLQDQENHQHCRRLQLKDMLPAGFQRLSKYPLLLESLLSYTDRSKQTDEYYQILKALDRSREILAFVNAAVQNSENNRRLREIQKRLDQSSLIKNKHGKEDSRVELDLTKHKLIYEGSLTWKTRGQKNIDLLVLLIEEGVVLLQKDNEKYILRYHSTNKSLGKDGKDDNKLNQSPIIKFGTFLFRQVATDKCAFFLVLTQSTLSAQIYELVAMSPNEAKLWLRHLHDAQSAYDARGGRRSQAPQHIPDAEEPAPSSDQLRDVEDNEEGENTDAGDLTNSCSSSRSKQEQNEAASNNQVSTPDSVTKKSELLRRKDLKIREELEEKQNLIADILNIPREHFESVADMAGEVGLGNKEPRELVLGSIYQAKKLQEALNEAQAIRENDVMAAQACSEAARTATLPLYQAPMEKLLCISGTLTQLLNSLLSLVSERDDERDRMRKELVASRERLHQLHMQQNKPETAPQDAVVFSTSATTTTTTTVPVTATDPISPHSSRPSSVVSVSSSAADQSDVPDQHNVEEGSAGEESRCIPLSQNINSELSKFSDTSDGETTGLSQTSISEESEVIRAPTKEPSSPTPAVTEEAKEPI